MNDSIDTSENSENLDTSNIELNVDLSSGIAAYEAKHFQQALQLLSPLAEAGNPEAQYRLANMAQNGLGLHRNPLLAFRFMQAAANSGHPLAQHGLGFMYMDGDCATQSNSKAIEWFTKAAAQGLVGSQNMLDTLKGQQS